MSKSKVLLVHQLAHCCGLPCSKSVSFVESEKPGFTPMIQQIKLWFYTVESLYF